MPSTLRIGHGYDIHRLVSGRPMILGGVRIECDYGLYGHSDADCLTHAICDALLGAAGLPDIGHLFPNTDERWKGADSQVLLARVVGELRAHRLTLVNIDVTVIAERPAIQSHVGAMKRALGRTTGLAPEAIGIKATTNEGVGELGRGGAVAAHAVALIETI